MLFSSFPFVLCFLPLMLVIYFCASRWSSKAALILLVMGSSIFYAWHHPVYLLLIYGSIFFNYFMGARISKSRDKRTLVAALAFNVLLLVAFKYLDFVVDNLNTVFSWNLTQPHVPLPLAISFFTFQQIGFLIGLYKKNESVPSFFAYSSFVTFFPQLIAGPIVRHDDYLPQLEDKRTYIPSFRNFSIGGTIFIIGLFKKVIFADNAGHIADFVFGLPAQGLIPSVYEGWIGVFAYSFQIYFDFSGYSDMAIGLARMFNIRFPVNFNSPYKAASFIEFWRRWHISLSIFLKEYVYIPLGGNRKGIMGRYGNLILTMLIGGLWHGASWTFVIWGGLHGVYLTVNHLIRKVKKPMNGILIRVIKRLALFVVVSMTWVYFRAETIAEANVMLSSLFQFGQVSKLVHVFGLQAQEFVFHLPYNLQITTTTYFPIFCIVALFMPNIYEWMIYFLPAKDFTKPPLTRSKWFKRISWRPTLVYGVIVLILFVIAFTEIDRKNEFIYFQF